MTHSRLNDNNSVVVLRGVEELRERAGHLFSGCQLSISCVASDLHTWSGVRLPSSGSPEVVIPRQHASGIKIRKLYSPRVLLEPTSAQIVRTIASTGPVVRITTAELHETILIDEEIAILAGDSVGGARTYSVVRAPGVVRGVAALFQAAWRSATALEVYDAGLAELKELTPRIIEALSSGCKDDTAARELGLSVRTYRRRVAELMAALGAHSRFQAGVRARELGLVT